MLLGLVRPSAGSATVLGEPIDGERGYLARVGALVEAPAFVPALSARTNLLAMARLRGLDERRVTDVLDVVGLGGRAHEPVRRFSLGMKQRLGIATALLPDPELLVLDEPTNGLDPSGVVEIRRLLAELGREGRTVVVSSHVLAEIQAVCHHLVMVRFGDLLYSGPVSALLARAGAHVELRPEIATDLPRLESALVAGGRQVESADGIVRVAADAGEGARLNRIAASVGITLTEIRPGRTNLEEVFLQMTEQPDSPAAASASPRSAGEDR